MTKGRMKNNIPNKENLVLVSFKLFIYIYMNYSYLLTNTKSKT